MQICKLCRQLLYLLLLCLLPQLAPINSSVQHQTGAGYSKAVRLVQRQNHHNHSLIIDKIYSKQLQQRFENSTEASHLQKLQALTQAPPKQTQPAPRKPQLLEKVCIGTSNLMAHPQNSTANHYQSLVERYKDCTYVIGNLEITHLDDSSLDFSFLESILEITGYLLIGRVNVERIRMPNLQIIRGRELFKSDEIDRKLEFGLILIENELKSLELVNLREILAGSFGSYNNRNLCHVLTIQFEEILNSGYTSAFAFNGTQPDCPPCDETCQAGCWSDGPEMCQRYLKKNCAKQCASNRCFGPGASDCCHAYCAGGCVGPLETDCLACKNFYDDGKCIPECPPMQHYNPSKFSWDPLPNGKLAFGATCVKECPEHLLRDNGACVRTCPANKRKVNGECVPCGGQCNKGCQGAELDDFCVDNCNTNKSLGFLSFEQVTSSGSTTCLRCHPECRSGCNGTEARHCWDCKRVRDGASCVSECPAHKYNNMGVCEDCHKSCLSGCTGPSSRLGEGGCNACNTNSIINSTDAADCASAEDIAQRKSRECADGYYQEYAADKSLRSAASTPNRPVCRKCHHRCKTCTGPGTHTSVCECTKYVAGEQCEDNCPRDYFADETTGKCNRCSPECNGCVGPTEADCINCRVYKIYRTELPGGGGQDAALKQARPFNCTAQCPPDKPYRISESNILDLYCSADAGLDLDNLRMSAPGSISFLVILIASAAIVVCLFVYRCQLENDKRWKLTYQLSGIDDQETTIPSNEKANLRQIRSIKETELRRGKVLGSGFGGTVYQGWWLPEGGGGGKRPVAIKVLRDNGNNNLNKEFLDEAYIMASVEHKNLVTLLAICMTPSEMMLITPLMPLGSLSEHVRNRRNEIGSKDLLEWSKQIANGMAYLEERRLVHRDLALRNVLLQKVGRAMISDFGLAKSLELNQSEYRSATGKFPIKWLAPECIRERKFTHKSDVWAFGVTVWELVTFGARPFEEYHTHEVLLAIEKGARLEQPSYVSAEVYKVMYACWFYNPDDRPNFKSLVQNFKHFARDPQRYLICGSDGRQYEEAEAAAARARNKAAIPDLTPSTHNRLNEMFGFHGAEPRADKQQALDLNNNTIVVNQFNFADTKGFHQAKSEQPTDVYDYLMPSPCAMGDKFIVADQDTQQLMPHSAGYIYNATNVEYFMELDKYRTIESFEDEDDDDDDDDDGDDEADDEDARCCNEIRRSISSGNIPHSLV